jgi:PAS domain S-box-containing protein
MTDSHVGPDERIAVGVSRPRNQQLLSDLFENRTIVELHHAVPERTGLCVVDEDGLARSLTAIEAWKRDQHPTFAPVLLVSEGQDEGTWERHADKLGSQIDAILTIPKPRSAITARIESLLERRAYSKALLSEREMIDKMLETSPSAMTIMDTDGSIIRANDRAQSILGLTKSKIEERVFNSPEWNIIDEDGDTIPSEDLPLSRVTRTGTPVYGYEHGIERPDGETVWLSTNMAPVLDETGALEFLISTLDDITEQRNRKQTLERQVDLFEKTQDLSNVGAWEYDVQTQEAYFTSEIYDIYGLSADSDLSSELLIESFHPDDRPVIESAFERAVEDGDSYDHELKLITEDGDERWVRTRGEPQYEDGKITRVRGTLKDITDRKERNLRLRQMSRAVKNAPVGVTLTNPELDDPEMDDNPIVYVNQEFLELTGYERDEVLGHNCRMLQGERTDPEMVDKIRRALDEDEPVSVVLRNYHSDGTVFWNSLEIAPVRDANGDVINHIVFQQDVTERVERRRQLQKIDQVLRHNVKNSLTVIHGMADQVQRDSGESATAHAQQIIDTGESLLSTLEKEREITKLLGEDPTVESLELMSIVRQTVETVEGEYPEASVEVVGPDGVAVEASSHLRSALTELLRNAVEHDQSEQSTAALGVHMDGDSVIVEIADSGPGIPQMEVGILTGSEDETKLQHGQGLGLWLVQLIVRRSGGRIEFETGSDGSTVRVILPACVLNDNC